MAFRRVIFTSPKISDVKQDVERLFSLDKFKSDFPGLKTTIKPGAKPDVLVVDVNGDGADSVSRKLKDIGTKFKADIKIRNEIKTTPLKENNEEYKVGDIVIPKIGPHKGIKHKIIYIDGDKVNIKPAFLKASEIKYRLGAASTTTDNISKAESVDEGKLSKVKSLIKEEVRKTLNKN